MRKLNSNHLPMLRSLREVHLKMIDNANRLKGEESDIGMLMAYGHVVDQLHETSDKIARDLSRLERSPR